MTVIRNKLRMLMQAHGLNGPRLAELAGIPLPSVKSILQGRSKSPRGDTLQALANVFNCSMSYLI